MDEPVRSENAIREYLLRRVSDDETLEAIEELMFTDEKFCNQVALAEDGLIDDYVRGRLNAADSESFEETLRTDPDRLLKTQLTEEIRKRALARDAARKHDRLSIFASISVYLRQPRYTIVLAVMLVAVFFIAFYLQRRNADSLAELRSLYSESRPTETRISEFAYAPLTQLRGAPDASDERRRRVLENTFINAVQENPSAQTHYALAVFNLTEQRYPEAIKEFQNALKFAPADAKIHNDLGSAYFELAKTEPNEKKLQDLSRSFEEFSKATDLDGNLLEALFNKALAQQELGMRQQARESWLLYLQKDPSSPWAEEARKHLARTEGQTLFKSDEQVLTDFFTAYRNGDNTRAQRIHDETKGYLRGPAVWLQLSRQYLTAKQQDNEAKESLAALTFIADYEKAKNADAFFADFASFHANVSADKAARLLHARDNLDTAYQAALKRDYARAISQFETSRDEFAQLGDECDAAIAENWAAQFLAGAGRVDEGRRRLAAVISNAEKKKFLLLPPSVYYWLGYGDYAQNRFSESARNFKTALRLAEEGNNFFEVQHAEDALAWNYSNLGELEPALFYVAKRVFDDALYYQNRNQWLRTKGTLAGLLIKLKFFSTSYNLSKEILNVARENAPRGIQVNDAFRHFVQAAVALKDFSAALKHADDSLQIALAGGDDERNQRTKAEIYRLRAEVKSEAKDYRGALTDYDEALALYSRLPELTVGSYQIHKGRLFCFRELNDRESFAGELKTVLALSEEYRHTIREDSSRQAFFANEQGVFEAAAEDAISNRQFAAAFSYVEDSKARSLLEFVASRKSIAEVENDFSSVARSLTLPEIQARLPEQVQLVQYAVLPDKIAIWTVSKTRFDFLEKQIPAAELESKITAYGAAILAKEPPANIQPAARELYDLLIPPGLAADKQLCLVPDKFLHGLAFATLVSNEGRYLLQEHALFYAPSASVLVLASEHARSKAPIGNESVLSIGNPDFDREENPRLPDLDSAEDESRSVASNYQRALALTGGAATKEKFLKNLDNVDVVHFAGHYVANRQSPANSKLLFAGGELRSFELGAHWLSKPKLIVLSACETGPELFNRSEGAVGIARTFLALGAPMVVASLWKVDSEQTKELMSEFHVNRTKKRMSSVESLRQAQLAMLGGKGSVPFHWAAFSLFGAYGSY
jgi:CHAT domain-containing protein/TolA-binding protein